MVDETQIDIVINGLKSLYEKLAQKENPSYFKDKSPGEDESTRFDNEKDKCLTSLKELFLHRLKANREKRIK